MKFLMMCCLISQAAFAHEHESRLDVSIQTAIAGSLQELTVTYTLGDGEIAEGGGIRIEFPIAYLETAFLFWSKPQTKEPDLPGYVTGKTSANASITMETYGISGGIIECTVSRGALTAGDKIYISYRGQVQSLARDFMIRGQVRSAPNGTWQDIANPPRIKLFPQEANTLIVTAPADLVLGEPFDLAVVVLDKFGNLASRFRGKIGLAATDKRAVLPDSYTFTEHDSGMHVFENIVYNSPGFQKIMVEGPDNLKLSTHYSNVSRSAGTYNRYFGDTHFHTGTGSRNRGFITSPRSHRHDSGNISTLPTEVVVRLNSAGDHRGNFTTAEEAYFYAREVTRLDFASASEHDSFLFDQQAWEALQDITQEFYQPGKFTTLFAYEWTADITHHIVLYREKGSEVFNRGAYPDLPSLWAALDKQGKPALTIPHLTWNFKEHTNWDQLHNGYRKLGEIYSLWNSRFLVQPGDEVQRFELGKDDKWSFQYAWDQGHKIGVVGSTDNHLGQPGANNYTIYTQHTGGLAVVLSEENNRDRLWNALRNRRTYATTGTRIYIDFAVNGDHMGSEISSKEPPRITGRVAGTNTLASIEVVKYERGTYKSIYQISPESETAEFDFRDSNFEADCFYYLRVSQVDEVPGRRWAFPANEMAWSSPVWVSKSE